MIVPTKAASTVPMIVWVGWLVGPPVPVISTGGSGVTTNVVLDDWTGGSAALTTSAPEPIGVAVTSETGSPPPSPLLSLASTVVAGGSLDRTGVLPIAAVLVVPVLVLFCFVLLSVCCGRFGNCCFPVS